MKRNTFLIIAALAYASFGLGLAIAPAPFMLMFGVALNDGGQLMARVLGSALIGFTLIFWWIRNASDSEALQAVLRASCIYNVVDLPIVLMAVLSGVMGLMGWSAVVLHLFLAAGFGYFGFMKSAPTVAATVAR